ncbi:MAG: DNA polymerase III subunit beta [Patescibacteria group bacterium]
MKLSFTQENLNRGLEITSHIASRNQTLPILNNVLITTDNGVIKLTTTNLEIGINCQIRGKVEEEGKITVQAKLLADYVNSLSHDRVDFITEKESLKITSGKAQTVIKGSSSEEFPLIPKVEKKRSYQVNVKDFKNAVMQVIFASAADESRPEISGIFIKPESNSLTLAATDSYRLAERKIKLEKASKEGEGVIVPARTLQELIRILNDEVEILNFYLNENQILFEFEGIEMVSRLIEGQYPDYQQIIPKEHRTRVVLNTREFIKIIKTTSLFCKPGINDINLEFLAEGKAVVSASNTQIGENISEVEAKVEGDKNSIVFNYRYLLDGLSSLNTEEFILELTDEANPGLIKPVGQTDHLYIIMPIRQ